ncbi:MAG: hypothetical protein GC199_08960 [Alphaproteobacteria bacterium]|nr:hypothetical protein [Alphaproteobacteria bacterium]
MHPLIRQQVAVLSRRSRGLGQLTDDGLDDHIEELTGLINTLSGEFSDRGGWTPNLRILRATITAVGGILLSPPTGGATFALTLLGLWDWADLISDDVANHIKRNDLRSLLNECRTLLKEAETDFDRRHRPN